MTIKNHTALVETAMVLDLLTFGDNKSKMIRYMASQGFDDKRMVIAKTLSEIYYPDGKKEVRYQHVRNVLEQIVR